MPTARGVLPLLLPALALALLQLLPALLICCS